MTQPEIDLANRRTFAELAAWQVATSRPQQRCGAVVWPYTENNICVDKPGHDMPHTDARGRTFDHAGYDRP